MTHDGKRRTWGDLVVAAALFAVALSVVVSTYDMGFVRDEAFYFRHAETYQNWFVRVEKGGPDREEALTREEVLDTWRNNNEHPPLHKMLMGWSWRLLGRKLRPISSIRVAKPDEPGPDEGKQRKKAENKARDDGVLAASITGLGAAHGFDEGASVTLLRPQVVGKPPDIGGRELAVGTVVERDRWRAKVRFHRFNAKLDVKEGGRADALRALCGSAGPRDDGVIQRTGCEAVENRAMYTLTESAAMRFPGAVAAALIVALLFLAARGFFLSPSAAQPLPIPFAVVVGLGFLALPRPFWHAHLAVFDMTICALLVAATFAYQRSLSSRLWVGIVAVVWGFGLLAKHNAAVLPIAFIGHWAWDGLAEGRFLLRWPAGLKGVAWVVGAMAALVAGAMIHPGVGLALAVLVVASPGRALTLPGLPKAWFAMLPVGLLMLVAGWPLLWFDTLDNFLRWLEFHLAHEHYMQTYFGQVLAFAPFPWGFPWVMTALTWPIGLLAACVVGTVVLIASIGAWHWRVLRGAEPRDPLNDPDASERRGWWRLVVVAALWPTVLISMPDTPIFGGIKHWMPSYPFMLLLAGLGAHWAWRTAAAGLDLPKLAATAGAWVIAIMLALPAANATWQAHPHGSVYYNELIGGAPGAAEAGMQRQFWGGSTRDGLAEVNKRAPLHARIWFHKCAWGAFMMYQREGWFRRDLSYASHPSGTTHGFFHHQKDHDDYELDVMRDYRVAAPVMRSSLEGVPILSVYERP